MYHSTLNSILHSADFLRDVCVRAMLRQIIKIHGYMAPSVQLLLPFVIYF